MRLRCNRISKYKEEKKIEKTTNSIPRSSSLILHGEAKLGSQCSSVTYAYSC